MVFTNGSLFSYTDLNTFYSVLNRINLSYSPNKGESPEANRNGENILSTMTRSQKDFKYENDSTIAKNSPSPNS